MHARRFVDKGYDGRSMTQTPPPALAARPEQLIELIRASVIGDDEAFAGPFGVRRLTYADYTASGRSLAFIEDYIRDQVMPLYANTHTESSGTGLQTTRFREDARDIIREAVGADRDDYAVIFCGSGSTAAVDKLIGILNLRIPADLDERYDLSGAHPGRRAPGRLHRPLRAPLQRAALARVDRRRRHHRRGCRRPHRPGPAGRGAAGLRRPAAEDRRFSAASNVTGIKSDTRGDLHAAAPPRGTGVLGLRRGRALCRARRGPGASRR